MNYRNVGITSRYSTNRSTLIFLLFHAKTDERLISFFPRDGLIFEVADLDLNVLKLFIWSKS